MQEDLLQFIWRYQLYNQHALQTVDGEALQILKPGTWNKEDAGPDFTNARIRIDKTEWAGNIELHVNSKDWKKHGHQGDRAYNNVILHVVFNHTTGGPKLPTLELQPRIKKVLLENYEALKQNVRDIPCEPQINSIDHFTWLAWKERLLAERIEVKTERIRARLQATNYNWSQVFYEFLAYNFGLTKNAEPLMEAAVRLPITVLQKHKNNLFQLEALLFGIAGLLQEPHKNTYHKQLRKEFQFLKKKYSLQPLSPIVWKFSRMRPAAFPTIRLAQFAQLVYHSKALFSKILELKHYKDFKSLLTYPASEFWNTHFTFDKETPNKAKKIGKTTVENIIINTIVPFQFLYGKWKNEEPLTKNSLKLLESLKPERNSITKRWQELNLNIDNAYDSQALIYLRKQYCANFKCLQCRIGLQLLKQEDKFS